MNPRALPAAALLGALLLAPLSLRAAADMFPPQVRGATVARLEVRVAGRGPGPGLGQATMTVTVTGPATLAVEPPQLSDPTGAWKEPGRAASWALEDGRVTWSESAVLRQVKPGPVPLPDVKVRFRDGPAAPWQEAEWTKVLQEPRDLPPPAAPPPLPARRWWLLGAGLGLGALVLAAAGVAVRRRRSAPRPLPADERALRELDRVAQGVPPPGADAEAYYTQLSDVVRGYLAERFGLRAPQQTTAEFLRSVRQARQLSEPQQELLRDFFARCDLAKFARTGSSPEECHEAAERARAFVRQTAPGGHEPA